MNFFDLIVSTAFSIYRHCKEKMNIQKDEDGSFLIKCSQNELAILSNALNNIPQAVDEQEYTTLISASKSETNKILDTIVAALNSDPE
jgi:hypothetical protein